MIQRQTLDFSQMCRQIKKRRKMWENWFLIFLNKVPIDLNSILWPNHILTNISLCKPKITAVFCFLLSKSVIVCTCTQSNTLRKMPKYSVTVSKPSGMFLLTLQVCFSVSYLVNKLSATGVNKMCRQRQ